MSVFSRLCLRARELGARRLIFSADLYDREVSEGICGEWSCTGGGLYGGEVVGTATGRTGEEALRNLVDELERRAERDE